MVHWTTIGNPPNLAARLQSLTRELEAAMVIDAATWGAIDRRARAEFEPHERITIRGRSDPMNVYAMSFESLQAA